MCKEFSNRNHGPQRCSLVLETGPRPSDCIYANKVNHAHTESSDCNVHIFKMLEWLLELSQISSEHVLGDC